MDAERLLGVQGNIAALYVADENRVAIKRISTGDERALVSKCRNQSMPARAFVAEATQNTVRSQAKKPSNYLNQKTQSKYS